MKYNKLMTTFWCLFILGIAMVGFGMMSYERSYNDSDLFLVFFGCVPICIGLVIAIYLSTPKGKELKRQMEEEKTQKAKEEVDKLESKYLSYKLKYGQEAADAWLAAEMKSKTSGPIIGKCPKCGSVVREADKVARRDYMANPLYHDNYYCCPNCGTAFNKSSFL